MTTNHDPTTQRLAADVLDRAVEELQRLLYLSNDETATLCLYFIRDVEGILNQVPRLRPQAQKQLEHAP